MSSFDSLIKLEVKIDPKNQAEQQLKQIVNNLSKLKINLNLDSNINSQLKQVSDNINKIYSNSNKKITLGDISKSAEESAKVFEGISEQIGKIRELSERRIKENNALQEAKEVNSALEEQYKLEQQMANIRSKADYNSKQREIQEQNQLNKTLEDEEKLINEIANKREQSSKTQKNIDNKNELNQAKAINKVLEDNYKASLKEVEVQKQVEAEIQKQIKLLEIKKQGILSKNSKADTSDIDNAITKYKQLNNLSMKDLRNEISYTNAELKNSSTSADSFISKLGKSLSNFGFYINIGDAIRGVFNSFKDGVQVVTDIDTAMRDLAKVSSATTEQLAKFPQIANQIAIETGTSSEAIIKATEYYSKLGYAISEASERAKNATIFANVADMNIDDASKSLITIAKGFDLNKLEDMTRIMDVANAVGNNFSSTSQNIAEGLRRSGNAMSEAGNSYEQSVGLFVSANASIQDAETVGNAIKTITMRLRGMKTEIDETGIPVSKLRQAIKDVTATAGQTVDIMKDNNTFKSTYDIMNELAGVYPKLTDAQRSYLQYVIAGQRQGNVFSGMMNNMKEGVNAYTTALGASGSAMKEQEIYMNSIEGKTNALKETFKKFWVDSINSDTVKGFVDGLTSLVSTFGDLQTVVVVATTALLLFKGSAILGAITPIFTFGASLITLTGELGATVVASDLLSASMSKLSAITSANPFGIIALACTGAVLAIQKVNSELDKVNDKITPLNESLSDLSNIKSNEALVKQYEDLEKVINSNTSSTEEITSAKEQLLQVQKQIASNMPELITGYTAEGEAVATNIEKIKSKISNDLNGTIKQAQSSYKDLFDQLNSNNVDGFARYNNTYDERTQIEEYQELLNKQGEWTGKESERYTELNKKISSMNQAVMQLQSNGQDVSGMKIFDFETGKLVDAKQYIDDMAKSSDNAKSSADNLADGIDGIGDSADNASKKLEDLAKGFNNLSSTNSDIDSVIEDLKSLGGISEQTYAKIIDNPAILQALTSEGDVIQNLTKLQEENRQSMEDRIQQAVDTANGVNSSQQSEADSKADADNQKLQSDANTNNQIRQNTSDTTNSNADNYNTDGSNFDNTSQDKNVSDSSFQGAWRENTAQSVNEMGGFYQTDYTNFKSATDAKNALLENFRSNLASMGSVFSNAEDAINPLVNTLTQPWNLASGSSEGIAGSLDKTFGTDSLNAIKQYKDGLSQIAGTFDSISGKKITTENTEAPEIKKVSSSAPSMVKGNSGGGSSSKGGSGGSSKQSDAEKWSEKIADLSSDIDIDRYADLNSQLEILDNNLTDNKNSLNGLTEGTKAYYDKQKEQIDIIKQQASTYSLLAGSYATERDELKQKLSQYGILTDATGKLTNAEAKLKYQQDLANDMSGNTEAEYNAKKKQIDATKELQENIKRYREVTESEIPKCTQKWDELNESIVKTQKEQLQSLLDSLASSILVEMKNTKKTELADLENWYTLEKEKLSKDYQDDVDDIQNKKQSVIDYYDKQIADLQKQLDEMNDDSTDKKSKLAKLQSELTLWEAELDKNNPFAKSRVNDLTNQITALQKEIKKDDIQKQMDDLKNKQKNEEDYYDDKLDSLKGSNDDELKELDDSYKTQKDKLEEKYDDDLMEQKSYEKAKQLILSNSHEEMLTYLNSQSQNWRKVGDLLGENFKEGLVSQVQQAIESLNSLTGGTLGSLSNDTYSSKESNMATSSGNNSSSTNSKSSGNTINGKSYTVDSNGNISSKDALSNEEIEEILKKVPRYATGGDINIKGDKEKLIFAGGGEKVLNPTDSNTLNKLSEFVDSGTLDNLFNLAKSIDISGVATIPNNISIPTGTISGMNFRNISNSNTNNNTTNGDVNINMNNNINNNNLQQLGMNQRMLEKMIGKAVSNSISKYGGKK